jgi:hypothetical protein
VSLPGRIRSAAVGVLGDQQVCAGPHVGMLPGHVAIRIHGHFGRLFTRGTEYLVGLIAHLEPVRVRIAAAPSGDAPLGRPPTLLSRDRVSATQQLAH